MKVEIIYYPDLCNGTDVFCTNPRRKGKTWPHVKHFPAPVPSEENACGAKVAT